LTPLLRKRQFESVQDFCDIATRTMNYCVNVIGQDYPGNESKAGFSSRRSQSAQEHVRMVG
jgi:hypothetical protein